MSTALMIHVSTFVASAVRVIAAAAAPDAPQAPAGPVAPSAPSAPAATDAPSAAPANAPASASKPKAPQGRVDQLPPFRVLLHNDDVNDMEHVVRSLISLAGLRLPRAVEVTLEAHETGVALVVVTHKERAELVAEQLASTGLTATIEPAN